MSMPILWSFRRCPYAMRGRMALYAAGVTCELREIQLSRKPDAFLDTSPTGTVPMLAFADGTIIEESLEVMIWALGQHDPYGWRDGPEVETDALIAENDGQFKHHLDRYKYPSRYEGVDSDKHFSDAIGILSNWNLRIEANGGGLVDAAPRLADIAIFPFVRQFVSVNRARVEDQNVPHLLTWLERHVASETFTAIMQKHALWDGGTGAVVFSDHAA